MGLGRKCYVLAVVAVFLHGLAEWSSALQQSHAPPPPPHHNPHHYPQQHQQIRHPPNVAPQHYQQRQPHHMAPPARPPHQHQPPHMYHGQQQQQPAQQPPQMFQQHHPAAAPVPTGNLAQPAGSSGHAAQPTIATSADNAIPAPPDEVSTQSMQPAEHNELKQHLQHRAVTGDIAPVWSGLPGDDLQHYAQHLDNLYAPSGGGGGSGEVCTEVGCYTAHDGAEDMEGLRAGLIVFGFLVVLACMTLIYIAIRKYSKSCKPRSSPRYSRFCGAGGPTGYTNSRVQWDPRTCVSTRLYSGPHSTGLPPKVHVSLALAGEDSAAPGGRPNVMVNPGAGSVRSRSKSPAANKPMVQQCV